MFKQPHRTKIYPSAIELQEMSSPPPSLFRKIVSSFVLFSYLISFIVSPVYASTSEVVLPPPSRFHRPVHEGRERLPHDHSRSPAETPLQRQFRLWNSLPPLLHKVLPFDADYQPLGWNAHYQVSLAFEHEGSQGVLAIPSSKNFVNKAGAAWLQHVYEPLGWQCALTDAGSTLEVSYCPTGSDPTIAFSLNRLGNVRLHTLNVAKGVFFTSSTLLLDIAGDPEDIKKPTQLIMAAPEVHNETPLTNKQLQLQLFTHTHVNLGGYTAEHVNIKAKHTTNHQPITTTKGVEGFGQDWHNLADVTGSGPINLTLYGTLDNHGHTISSSDDRLTLLVQTLNNEQGTLEGDQAVVQFQESLNNAQGKIISRKQRVYLKGKTLLSETGLIQSPEGVDLCQVDHTDIGGIDTQGDVMLKEGHFTLTPSSAMGNSDTKSQHKINRLVIEPNTGSPNTVLELLGTIKARFFQAFKSTILGKDAAIDEINAESGAKLTFVPGQIKKLKAYLKDNPLSLEYIEELERLEWLLLSEADVLPYDINTSGKLILRAAPGAVIPQWPMTRNARAFKGLELHLLNTHVVMGDAQGVTYPEWIADTGPLLWYLNSFDQKSGKIKAMVGGRIETQECMKFGEVHHITIKPSAFSEQTVNRIGHNRAVDMLRASVPDIASMGYHAVCFRSRTTDYYEHALGFSIKPASLGAGGDFVLHSHHNDIDFCFAHVELARFAFITPGSISFLSTKMHTTAGGLLRGKHLFLKPDDKYLPLYNNTAEKAVPLAETGYKQYIYLNDQGAYWSRYENRLVKTPTYVSVDGDIALDITESIQCHGSIGVASGKLHNIAAPRTFIKEPIYDTRQVSCRGHGGGLSATLKTFPADLMTSDQMLLKGYQAIMQGVLSGPIIQVFTNDFQLYMAGNRRPQLAATPATLHDLSRYVSSSPFHRMNPNPLGPSIIHDFIRMAAPPSVYYHHGRFSTSPLPGARQRYDHPILAQAMVEALVSQLKECYIQPHASFNQNYLLANLNSVKALANIKRHYPELVDETHMLPALPSTEKSTLEVAKKAEKVSERFGDQPAILHVLEEDGQYTSYLHTPASSVHRSLKRSEALLLGREKILIAPLDDTQASYAHIAGAAIDSSDQGIIEFNTDHTYVGPHHWTEIDHATHKKGKKKTSETITRNLNHNAFIGGKQTWKGKTHHFEGPTIHLDGDSTMEATESVRMDPAYSSTSTQSTSSSRNDLGRKSTKSSVSSVQTPELVTIEGEKGDEQLTIITNTATFTSPNIGVPTTLEAQHFNYNLAHRQAAFSSVSHSSDPFVQRTTIRSNASDEAVPGHLPMGLTVNLTPGGTATIQHLAGEAHPNITVNPEANVQYVPVANTYTSHEKSRLAPGAGTIGALALLGSLAGGQLFGLLFETAGAGTAAASTAAATTASTAATTAATTGVTMTAANLTAAQIISASTLAMAKAATCFMGSHLFQGLATGNFKVDIRGIGTTIAAAALIGSGPNLDAKATFMDNLASQVVHELHVAPTRMAINMAIGGEKFEDAAVSTLRQGAGHAIGATLAHQIGQFYQGPDKLDYFTHKLAHFAAGAIGGTIAANDPLGGGFSAAFAEVAMEAMTDAEAISDEIYLENPTMNEEEFKAAFRDKTMAKRYFSQVIGGFVGTLAGNGNFGVAASTAAIALDYNMCEMMAEKAKESYLEAQQFVESRVDERLTSLEKAQKRPYTAEEKIQVRDNLRKFYMRSYLDYKASGLLVEGAKFNPAAGAIITSAEVAYGYATGNMDAYEATTSMVGATTAAAGRAGKLFNLGSKAHDAAAKKETATIKAKEAEDVVGQSRIDSKLFQEHHIISNKNDLTRNHDLIRFSGFNLDSKANKMLLPTQAGSKVSTTSRSIHDGRHLDSVSRNLAKEMNKATAMGKQFGWNQAQYNAALGDIIAGERAALKSGDRILNKHHRPWATDGGKVIAKGDTK